MGTKTLFSLRISVVMSGMSGQRCCAVAIEVARSKIAAKTAVAELLLSLFIVLAYPTLITYVGSARSLLTIPKSASACVICGVAKFLYRMRTLI